MHQAVNRKFCDMKVGRNTGLCKTKENTFDCSQESQVDPCRSTRRNGLGDESVPGGN